MTKEEMLELVKKYDMVLHRHEITGEAICYRVESDELIPELDKYADSPNFENVAVRRMLTADQYVYDMFIPHGWIDIWGE